MTSIRERFRTRVLAGTTLVMVVIGVTVIFATRAAMEKGLKQEAEHYGLLLGRYVAAASTEAILSESPVELLKIRGMVRDIKESEPHLAYCFIVAPDKRVLVHTFEGGIPAGLLGKNPVPPGQEYSVASFPTTEGHILEYATPLWGPGSGEVHVGLFHQGIFREMELVTRVLAAVFAGGFALSLLFLYIVAGYVSRPVKSLIEAARRVGSGDLSARVPGKIHGEVGELAATFNWMVEELGRFSEKLQNMNRELEQEVAERRRAEESLKVAEKKIRGIWNNAQTGMLVIEPETHRIVDVNLMAAQLAGLPPEKILGRECHEFLCPAERGKCPITDLNHSVDHEERILLSSTGEEIPIFKSVVKLNLEGRSYLIESFIDIGEQKKLSADLVSSLHEKETLLKEIHHRVKNNLQAISGLLNLQAQHIKGKRSREVFKDSQNRVLTMALIHEKLYQMENLSEVDFGTYLESLVRSLLASYNISEDAVALNLETDNVRLVTDTAIPCGLIVNELVSNALKHAFPNGGCGEVRIGFHEVGKKRYRLEISDNGVGFPAKVDIRKARSLGLALVFSLVDQLAGEIEVNGEKGTRFTIEFGEYREAEKLVL